MDWHCTTKPFVPQPETLSFFYNYNNNPYPGKTTSFKGFIFILQNLNLHFFFTALGLRFSNAVTLYTCVNQCIASKSQPIFCNHYI